MLELARPRPSWQGAAYEGFLTLPGGEQQAVMVLLGPEGSTEESLNRARRLAAVPLTLRHPGVVRLLQVTAYRGRAAWCYEHVRGLGMGNVVGREGFSAPSARACAELVAQVAEILLGLGNPGLHHPGPEPTDLVLGSDGRVKLMGFAGPHPAGPAMRAPAPENVESAAVYRLGVLLTTLISGQPPAAATEASAHAVLVRRALIRAMDRPGPVLSEQFGQWIRGMLAWAPAERPPLSAVPAGLRSVGWNTGGEGLVDWSTLNVPRLVREIEVRHSDPPQEEVHEPEEDEEEELSDPRVLRAIAHREPPPRRLSTDEVKRTPRPAGTPTIAARKEALSDLGPRDAQDHTQERFTDEPTGDSAQGVAVPRSVRRRPVPDTIPVGFGPPPEAVSKAPPSLPPGFLEGDGAGDPDTGPVAALGDTTEAVLDGPQGAWVAALAGFLGLLAIVFIVYLVYGEGDGNRAANGGSGPALGEELIVEPLPEQGRVEAVMPQIPPPDLAPLQDDTDALGLDAALEARATDEAEQASASDAPDPSSPEAPASPRETAADQDARGGGAVAPDRPRDRGLYVIFRLAPGLDGALGVSCDGRSPRSGATQYIEERLTPGQACRVWARDARGVRRAEDVVTIGEAPMTIDCFHNWSAECLD